MVVADLHLHTTNSDGRLTLATLPRAAREADVDVVAVTDHDRLHPELPGGVSRHDGVTVVHGLELRVAADCGRVDLLGYGARRTPELSSLLEYLQADRIERGREMIECVEDRLGVALPVEPREGLGRPHVARAIAAATDYGYQDAFDELVGDDCPCYVARDVPGFEAGLEALSASCGVVSLAHPLRYDDPEAALGLCADLEAVERYYPYEAPVDHAPVERAVERHDLLVTGGSDAHEKRLGLSGLDRDDYLAFREAL